VKKIGLKPHTHNMSDKATDNVVPVTEAPKDAPAAEGEKGPSKGALKKAAKEKEKVCGMHTCCNT
jgi:hypothetical protein